MRELLVDILTGACFMLIIWLVGHLAGKLAARVFSIKAANELGVFKYLFIGVIFAVIAIVLISLMVSLGRSAQDLLS